MAGDERTECEKATNRELSNSIAMMRATEEALREETRVLELLNGIGRTIASTLDMKVLVQTVTDSGRQLSGAEFGAFFYNSRDRRGDSFQLYAVSGISRETFELLGRGGATALFAPTFQGEKAIRVDDILKDPRFGKAAAEADRLPVRSYLAAPVVSRTGEVIGGLFFGHSLVGVFTERAERLVVGVAAQAAVAIDNARLYQRVRRLAEDREELLDAERAARSQAERMNQMKDEFLATLSHELRTPLNAILGWSELLQSGKVTPDDLKEGLETISRNARAQTQLVEDLLDMSRVASGKVRLELKPVMVSEVVETVLHSVRPAAEAKGILLAKFLDPEAGAVSGDPVRLQQVVWNLLSNAVKFTPAEGRVEVRVEGRNSHVEVTVSDSGMGIEPEFLPHVFERFRQADSSTTRTHGGLGLGLAIVKQLVELHGGTIRVKSEGLGCGSTFVVELPLAPVTGGTVNLTGERAEAVDLAGVKVLVVEDEADTREVVRRMLSQNGAEVVTASSAEEGLVLLKSERPAVLVSDIGMPGKDGYAFMREVRRSAEGMSVPAVALTAFARPEDRKRAMVAGFQVHLAKPIEPGELVATVGCLAGRR